MKILFDSFLGNKWCYNVQTAEVKQASNSIVGDKVLNREHFTYVVNPVYHVTAEDIDEAIYSGRQALVLNVTEECSNRCKYCVYGGGYPSERGHSHATVDVDVAIKAVDEFINGSNPGKRSISFYGGEPMFPSGMKVIEEVVSHIERRCPNDVKYTFTTNGNHLNSVSIEYLVKNRFRIMVSLDGPREVHDRYRRTVTGMPTFDKVMSGLRAFKDMYPDYYDKNVGFICVLTPPLDYLALSEFWSTNELVKGHSLMISNVSLFGQILFSEEEMLSFSVKTIEMTRNAVKKYYECICNGDMDGCTFERGLFEKDLAILHERQGDVDSGDPDLMGRCIPGGRKCFVNTDGRYYACEKMQGGYDIGDVNRGINSSKVEQLISDHEKIIYAKCRLCPYAKICTLCYVSAYDESHHFSAKRLDENCVERRSFNKLIIRLYASLLEKIGYDRLEELLGQK